MDAYNNYVNECTIAGNEPITFPKFIQSLTFTTSNMVKYAFYANECSKANIQLITFYEFVKDFIAIEDEEEDEEEEEEEEEEEDPTLPIII